MISWCSGPAGNQFRRAARVMAAYARVSGDHANTCAIVIVRLAEALAERTFSGPSR